MPESKYVQDLDNARYGPRTVVLQSKGMGEDYSREFLSAACRVMTSNGINDAEFRLHARYLSPHRYDCETGEKTIIDEGD